MANLLDRFGLRDLAFNVATDVKDVAVGRLETEFDERVGSRLQTFVGTQAAPVQQVVSDTGREFVSGGKAVSEQDARSLAQAPRPSALPTGQVPATARAIPVRLLLIVGAIAAGVWYLTKGRKRRGRKR